ncbi:glycosyltransferase family 2 protein, partial [Candidatus Aminicenantes bacterium AC-334-K16]|nr:glycosyltransferase family 2 protein [Candidatus Aminicenantes bacterium AC-334-K16]
LEPCLQSIQAVADEIIVVDAYSQDETVKVAEKYRARVFKRSWTNYSDQKNFGNSRAKFPWIFSIDADERLSPQLKEELLELKTRPAEPPEAAFSVPRIAYYLGRWIRHSGWYPDRKIRLFRQELTRWVGDYVHEKLEVEGAVGKLNGHLYHFTYDCLADHLERINLYSGLAAKELYAQQKKCRWHHLLLLPFCRFLKSYLLQAGFLDGFPGLVISVLSGYGTFVRYAKLKEIWKKGEKIEPFPD